MICLSPSIGIYSRFPYAGSTLRGIRWWDAYSTLDAPLWRGPRFWGISPTKWRGRKLISSLVSRDAEVPSADGFEVTDGNVLSVVECASADAALIDDSPYVPICENFAETAFFYPALRTDTCGVVTFSFTLPESLTEWKFMGFAHTRNMDFGQITAKAKAVKPFMVQPSIPRFVRVGDKVVIPTGITNLSDKDIQGTVRMDIIDPQTNQILSTHQQAFSALAGATVSVSFALNAPSEATVWICRVVAEGDKFSDGEQRYLPVLSDK